MAYFLVHSLAQSLYLLMSVLYSLTRKKQNQSEKRGIITDDINLAQKIQTRSAECGAQRFLLSSGFFKPAAAAPTLGSIFCRQ